MKNLYLFLAVVVMAMVLYRCSTTSNTANNDKNSVSIELNNANVRDNFTFSTPNLQSRNVNNAEFTQNVKNANEDVLQNAKRTVNNAHNSSKEQNYSDELLIAGVQSRYEEPIWGCDILKNFNPTDEVIERRDQFAKTFRNDDKSFTAIWTAGGSLNYKDEAGQWQTIDTRITANHSGKHPDYDYANTTNNFKSYYSTNLEQGNLTEFNAGTVRDGLNKQLLWLDQNYNIINAENINKTAQAVINPENITWSNVFHNIDLMYTNNIDGRKMDYFLQNSEALSNTPNGAKYLAFAEDIDLPNGWSMEIVFDELITTSNFINVFNENGHYILSYDIPKHYDANDVRLEYQYKLENNTIYTLVPIEWLNSEERAFPVKIDPTFTWKESVSSGNTFSGYCTGTSTKATNQIRVGHNTSSTAIFGFSKFPIPLVDRPLIEYVNFQTVTTYYYKSGFDPNNGSCEYVYAYCYSIGYQDTDVSSVNCATITTGRGSVSATTKKISYSSTSCGGCGGGGCDNGNANKYYDFPFIPELMAGFKNTVSTDRTFCSGGIISQSSTGSNYPMYATFYSNNSSTSGTTNSTCPYMTVTYTVPDPFTVTFDPGAGSLSPSSIQESSGGAGVTLPTPSLPSCGSWTFAGWSTSPVSETPTSPTLYAAGTTYNPTSNMTLYAVYKQITGESTTGYQYTRFHASDMPQDIVPGANGNNNANDVFLIQNANPYNGKRSFFTGNISNYNMICTTPTEDADGSVPIFIPAGAMEFKLTSIAISVPGVGNNIQSYRIQNNQDNQYLMANSSGLSYTASNTGWVFWGCNVPGQFSFDYSTTDWGAKWDSNGDKVTSGNYSDLDGGSFQFYFWRRSSSQITVENAIYNSNPVCCSAPTLEITSANQMCGDNFTLDANVTNVPAGTWTYQWSGPGGFTSPSNSSPAYTLTPAYTAGTYTLTVSGSTCTATKSQIFTVGETTAGQNGTSLNTAGGSTYNTDEIIVDGSGAYLNPSAPSGCGATFTNGGFESTSNPSWTFAVSYAPGQTERNCNDHKRTGSCAARLGWFYGDPYVNDRAVAYATVDLTNVEQIKYYTAVGKTNATPNLRWYSRCFVGASAGFEENGTKIGDFQLDHNACCGASGWTERIVNVPLENRTSGQILKFMCIITTGATPASGYELFYNYIDDVSFICTSSTPPTTSSITSKIFNMPTFCQNDCFELKLNHTIPSGANIVYQLLDNGSPIGGATWTYYSGSTEEIFNIEQFGVGTIPNLQIKATLNKGSAATSPILGAWEINACELCSKPNVYIINSDNKLCGDFVFMGDTTNTPPDSYWEFQWEHNGSVVQSWSSNINYTPVSLEAGTYQLYARNIADETCIAKSATKNFIEGENNFAQSGGSTSDISSLNYSGNTKDPEIEAITAGMQVINGSGASSILPNPGFEDEDYAWSFQKGINNTDIVSTFTSSTAASTAIPGWISYGDYCAYFNFNRYVSSSNNYSSATSNNLLSWFNLNSITNISLQIGHRNNTSGTPIAAGEVVFRVVLQNSPSGGTQNIYTLPCVGPGNSDFQTVNIDISSYYRDNCSFFIEARYSGSSHLIDGNIEYFIDNIIFGDPPTSPTNGTVTSTTFDMDPFCETGCLELNTTQSFPQGGSITYKLLEGSSYIPTAEWTVTSGTSSSFNLTNLGINNIPNLRIEASISKANSGDLSPILNSWEIATCDPCIHTTIGVEFLTLPMVQDDEIDVSTSGIIFGIKLVDDATDYALYFGESADDLELNDGSGSISFSTFNNGGNLGDINYAVMPSTLSSGTTYYWRIDPVIDGDTLKTCEVYSFTTLPPVATCPNLLSPANAATDILINDVTLKWSSQQYIYDGTPWYSNYAVYYKKTSDPTYTPANTTDTVFVIESPLSYGTNYTWFVVPHTSGGPADSVNCTKYTFTTADPPPDCISSPMYPDDNYSASQIETDAMLLMWGSEALGGTATSYDIYFGTDNPPATLIENVTVGGDYDLSGDGSFFMYPISDLDYASIYYWQIIPKNISGEASGCDTWSFTTYTPEPLCTNPVSPVHEATDIQGSTVSLTWNAATYATSYEIYFGVTNPPATLVTTTSATTHSVSVSLGNTYYWRIIPKNGTDTASNCDTFWFKMADPAPNCTTLNLPADNALNVSLGSTLTWNAATYATSYDVYFGTTTTPPYVGNTTATSYTPSLSAGQTYYWQIIPKNVTGSALACDIRKFTTVPPLPTCVTLIAPTNGLTEVPGSGIEFSWNSVANADSYDLYIGTTSGSLSPIATNIIATSYILPITLDGNTQYYWSIVAKNFSGESTVCQTFSFVTKMGGPTFINSDEEYQIVFDNARINTLTPIFKIAYPQAVREYVVEINDECGSSGSPLFEGTYTYEVPANDPYYAIADLTKIPLKSSGGLDIFPTNFDGVDMSVNSASTWFTTGGMVNTNTSSYVGLGNYCVGHNATGNSNWTGSLKTPAINASGQNEIELSFSLWHSFSGEYTTDNINFTLSGATISAIEINDELISGTQIPFDQIRMNAKVKVIFNISAVGDKSNIVINLNATSSSSSFFVYFDDMNVQGTSFTARLTTNKTYYVRAKAKVLGLWTDWSKTHHFTYKNDIDTVEWFLNSICQFSDQDSINSSVVTPGSSGIDGLTLANGVDEATFVTNRIELSSFLNANNWISVKINQNLNGGDIKYTIERYQSGNWIADLGFTNFSNPSDGEFETNIKFLNPDDIRIKAVLTKSGAKSFDTPEIVSITITGIDIVPLPITWLSFTGVCNNNSALLNWKTASETNSDHFEIERSDNSTDFETIGKAIAKGNSSSLENYYFTDYRFEGSAYYRIKMLDIDGKLSYSKIIYLSCEKANRNIFSYPNPFDGSTFHIQSDKEILNAEINVYDMSGKLIKKLNVEKLNGTYTVNMDNQLQPGSYVLKLKSKESKIDYYNKLIVK